MTSEFEYNAPTYRRFDLDVDDSSDGADTFFDVDSEEHTSKDENKENSQPETLPTKQENAPQIKEDNVSLMTATGNVHIKTEVQSPFVEVTDSSVKSNRVEEPTTSNKRELLKAVRRLSGVNRTSNVAVVLPFSSGDYDDDKLSKDLNKLTVKAKKRTHFDGISINVKEEKHHPMTTRNDEALKTPKLELRTRVVKKETMFVQNRKRKSDFGLYKRPEKYLAVAEQVLHFQKDTPPRFHTSKQHSSAMYHGMLKARQSYNPRRTIALTPKLMTSSRIRPVEVLSQEEKEKLELEDIKKNQVKALPLNEKVLQPPRPIRKSIRPKTIQEPFNLTHVFKKPAPKYEEKPYKFTAKPVPKVILERPVGVGPKPEHPVTIPQSPAITKSTRFQKLVKVATLSNDNKAKTEDLINFGVPYATFTTYGHRKTEIKPFSFEVRDKEIQEKKEKKIQEILEAEKKAREFKANPAPVFDLPKEINRSTKHSHLDCSKSSLTVTTEETHEPFKARSPKVLRKPPFKPVREHTHSQPQDIQLWTQRRAQERQLYEMNQLEKEERLAGLKEQMEMEKKRKEEEEIAKLRQETVHKAQPMPKFKTPKKSSSSMIPLTEPKSPRFSKRTRNLPTDTSQLN